MPFKVQASFHFIWELNTSHVKEGHVLYPKKLKLQANFAGTIMFNLLIFTKQNDWSKHATGPEC